MKRFLLQALFSLLSRLPWSVLQLISALLYFFLYSLLGYRKKVVEENLMRCFPEWDSEKRNDIIRKFYRHFCDLFIQVIKSYNFRGLTLDKHIQFEENEALKQILDPQGKSILLFGHYQNWEWITQACGLFFLKKHGRPIMGFYKTIKDKQVELFINQLRTRYGGEMYSDKKPMMVFKRLRQAEPVILGTVADQTPPGREQMFMVSFLNTPTPFFTGPGWLAANSGVAVYYGRWIKLKRHQYKICFEPLYIPNPEMDTDKNAIMESIILQYAEKLEQQIREAPEYWLWTHRRWKYV